MRATSRRTATSRARDVGRAETFPELFSGLYIADHPTPERSRYLVLRLDFAGMTTDQGDEALRRSFTGQLREQLV